MSRRTFRPGQGGFILPAHKGGSGLAKAVASAAANAVARSAYVEPATAPGRRTLETLLDGECRFPIGDPQSAGFTYCGETAAGDYCAAHARACRPPPQVRRRLDEMLGITAARGGRK